MNRRTSAPLLVISESAKAAMIVAATKAHPEEIGGILVGVQVGNEPGVTGAIEIPSPHRGRHHYKIPAGATQPAVHAARRADQRLGYLGDWHTHPADVGPSPTDLATLAIYSIKHPRSLNPSLVVVRNSDDGYTLDARRITSVTPRICEVRLAGDLPSPGVGNDHAV